MKKRIISISLSIMMIFAMIPSMAFAANKMTITWFDVGAGDSMIIIFPNNSTVLIDGGLPSNGPTIVSKLKNMGVNSITHMISTHPDTDHIGGLQEVFESMSVKNFYYPKDAGYETKTAKIVLSLANEEGCKILTPTPGKKLAGGDGAYLQFVQHSFDYNSSNEDSVASYINYGTLQLLTMGDCEKGSEIDVAKRNIDILQLPHHGSKYASSSEMLKRFDPEKVVISTDGKKYGHPNKEVFQRCNSYDKNIKVWRTDKKGDISLYATKGKYAFDSKGVSAKNYINGSNSDSNYPSEPTKTGKYVYTTATGKKYHCIKTCRGLSNAKKIYAISEKTAKGKTLTKCSLCW